MIDAIVIAGGRAHDEGLIQASGQDCKAMIELAGKPMIGWVAEGLKSSKHIGSVIVVSRRECEACAPGADVFLEEAEDETANLVKAIEQGAKSERIFMMSGDMPLITREALDDFFENAPDADVVYPIVERGDIWREFGDRKWIYFQTPDGCYYTGSSCFLFKRQAVLDRVEWVRKVMQARRSVFQLAKMWGPMFILKFLTHKLTIEEAERTASRVLGLSGRAYVSRYPVIAMDVDHADDLPLVRERLANAE